MTNWIDVRIVLPQPDEVCLVWGKTFDENEKQTIYLANIDPTTGWQEYPGLEPLCVQFWAPINTPKGETIKFGDT